MKKVFATLLLSLPMMAAAASNCDEISAGIAEKITNNGVSASQFQLKLIPADQAQQQIEGKIVGSCDRGQQNIVYVRLDGVTTLAPASVPAAPAPEENKTPEVAPSQESAQPQVNGEEQVAPVSPEPETPAKAE